MYPIPYIYYKYHVYNYCINQSFCLSPNTFEAFYALIHSQQDLWMWCTLYFIPLHLHSQHKTRFISCFNFFFFKFFTSKCTIYTKYLLFLFFMGSNQPNQTCKCQYTGRQTLINAFWNTCVIVVITPKTAVIGYNFLFRLIYRL